jgi:dTDP-4-dehydrorhamnose reductase
VADHAASPTYSPALAARTVQLIERGSSGIFHIGGGEAISWYDFARLIFRVAGIPAEVRPTNEREYRTAARRPRFSALSNWKMESVGLPPMPPLEDALREYLRRRATAVAGA